MNASKGYQLVQRLGAGISSPVYLAETANGRVAIREFKPASEPDSRSCERERTRFLEAGRAWMTLKHPRIVPVLEIIDEVGDAFIVMEYQDGETLQAALSTRRFSPDEANEILRQVALALDFAHDRGVVHGDLKPSDIFLVPKQGAKIADLGTSPRACWDSTTPMPATLMHEYLSPERLRDPDSASARSDQYSLAAIAYRMYTGQAPNAHALTGPPGATRIAGIVPPSRIDPHLSPSIDGPILRALDPDPERRYGSCREFFGTLGAALIGPAEDQHRGPRKALYVAAALIPILSVAAVLVSRNRSHSPAVPQVVAAPPPPQSKPVPGPTRKRRSAPEPAQGAVALAKPKPFTTPDVPPPPASRVRPVVDPPAAFSPARAYRIEVFSRNRRIENGSSFGFNDPSVGELGLGDLKAIVSAEMAPPSRARLQLEWSVNETSVDSRAASLNQIIEYGNEPTAGSYRLTLKLDGRPIQVFSFRITP